MMLIEKLLAARVVRVHSANKVELDVDLGFGVRIVRAFTLEGLDNRTVPDELATRAVHALVVLVGGKDVLIRPESMKPEARRAGVYLNTRIFGTPVGFVADVPGLPRPILDVAAFLNWIAAQDFDIALVRDVVHGKKSPHVEAS